MWKLTPYLMRLTGRFTFKLSRLAFCLFSFLLCRTADAQTVTNVDFFVVGSRYQMDGGDYVYDRIPTGCILFWSIKPESSDRAPIYRSESGHIAFSQVIEGSECLLLADSSGSPMPWFVNSGWRRNYTIAVEGGAFATKYAVYPHVINKQAYDIIYPSLSTGVGCSLFYLPSRPVARTTDLLARSGNLGFYQLNYDYDSQRRYNAPAYGVAVDLFWSSGIWYDGIHQFNNTTEKMEIRHAFRHKDYIISLDAFRSHLSSKWWLRNKYIVGSGGITAINIEGGTGMGGYDASEGSGPAAPSEGGPGLGGSVPGDITNPPVTPMGQNGKWVYDPETKLWNWHGDYADNASQLNPFDNSVMPENQERGGAQEATLRQVKDGVDGLAKEDTLQQIRISFEEFQKQQRITPSELQAMIDNAVVSVVDGQIQYWEGKNLASKLDGIKTAVDESANRVVQSQSAIRQQVELVKDNTATTAQKAGQIATALSPFGNIGNTINQINANISTIGDNIVNSVADIEIPENPTVDQQDTEEVDISEPELSQFEDWLTFDFPLISIPRVHTLADYDIGVMDWKIPFSYFSQSNGNIWAVVFLRVRTMLAWLVYLSATLGVVKAMGAGV